MATFRALLQSAARLNPKRLSPSPSSGFSTDRMIPYFGTGSMLFQVSMSGITQAGTHVVHLMFSGLQVTTQEQPLKSHLMREEGGKIYFIEKPTLNRHQMKSRCSCSDFFFSFAYPNWNQGVLWGTKPRPYKRLTTTYPPRNPKEYMGICRHIINAAKHLQQAGVIMKDS